MKSLKKIFVSACLVASATSAWAVSDIKLVQPSKEGGLSIMESLWNRQSEREYSSKDLSDQDLSNLLFAASGMNRPDQGKITSPTAMNAQEIDVYLFSADGVYRYNPAEHTLEGLVDGDYRLMVAGMPDRYQEFVLDAPVSLLLVGNPQKFKHPGEMNNMFAATDAGIMSENICLFCAGAGLATVPRGTMDREGLATLLNLPEEAICVLNLPVGYPKEKMAE